MQQELGLKKKEIDANEFAFDVCGGFQGGFHDFVEILKLYAKNSDNTILENEVFKLLINLGEKVSKEEAKGLMKELCEPAAAHAFLEKIVSAEKFCKIQKYFIISFVRFFIAKYFKNKLCEKNLLHCD